MNRSLKSNTLVLFGIVMAAVLVRGLPLILEPQFWAEEGRVYFRHAFNNGTWEGLVSAFNGYYQIGSNLVGTFAASLPLEYAALWFKLVSVVLTAMTLWFIIRAESTFLPDPFDRFLVAAALVAFSQHETFLNTINLHFYFPVAVWVLLGVKTLSVPQIGFLLFAFLHGVTSLFMAPFFFIKAVKYGGRSNWAVVALSGVVAVVQFAALTQSGFGGKWRFNLSSPMDLAEPMLDNVIDFLRWLPDIISPTEVVVLFAFYIALGFTIWKRRATDFLLFAVLPAILALVLVSLSGLKLAGGGRYALQFSPIQLGMVLWLTQDKYSKTARWILGLAILIVASKTFEPEVRTVGSWRQELEAARQAGTNEVQIPPEGWRVPLRTLEAP